MVPRESFTSKVNFDDNCYNPSLGLMTKARACKGASQEENWESHLVLSEM